MTKRSSVLAIFGSAFGAVVAVGILAAPVAFAQSATASCLPASAQDALGSSLQQLTNLADSLLVQNLPASILSADGNLVSAISEVVLQVEEACLPAESDGGGGAPVSVAPIPAPISISTPISQPVLPPTPVSNPPSAPVSTPTPSPTTSAPSLTAVQGYNPLTSTYETTKNIVEPGDTYLILYGTFAASGNTVNLNGQALPSDDITYQGANQINVSFDNSLVGTSFTVMVTNANGTSAPAITVNEMTPPPPAGNIITGVQGYNQTTLAYTDGTALADTYLILYGNFASASNIVAINGAAITPLYQGSTQINVSLAGIPAATQNTVTVTTPAGATGTGSFTITSPPPSVASCSGSSVMATDFPVTVLVTAATLNVRSSPSLSASLAGSETLSAGDVFMAVNEVQGDCFNDNNLWWVSSLGNYVWSGGTTVQATPSPAPSPAPTPSQSSNPTTTTIITVAGAQYPVAYSYLPDGEVQASFTFTYPNVGTNFPVAARGTQQYIYQAGEVGIVQSNGGVQVLNQGNDCSNIYGAAGCIEFNSAFVSLISNIKSDSPANHFPAGITFSTPPGTAAGTYLDDGLYPLSVTTDGNGNLLSAQSINASGYGSGIRWYNLGDGYYVQTDDNTHYVLEGPSVPSGDVVVMENFSVATSGGIPTSVSGNLAFETNAQLGSSLGYSALSTPGSLVTFSINAASVDAITNALNVLLGQVSGTPPASGGLNGKSSNDIGFTIINYCDVNPLDIYCDAWLYCLTYPNDPACISINNTCVNYPTSPSCPTSIPASTPTSTPATLPTSPTLGQTCDTDPQFPACSSPSSCTPGETQDCDSLDANACGMVGSETQTCGSNGTWSTCTAVAPSDSACPDYCTNNPISSCEAYCQSNPSACAASNSGSGSSSCTPGETQGCYSSANSCGLTDQAAQTCGNNGTWNPCTAVTPPNSDCSED